MNNSYLKEMYANAEGKTSLVLLNAKQLKASVEEISKHLSNESGMNGMIISYSYPSMQFLSEPSVQEINKENLVFVDLNSGKKGTKKLDGFKVINIENPANLTQLEIHLERFLKADKKPKFVLFESVSALSVYVKSRALQKFIYFLNNKISLEGGTLVILTVKDSLKAESLELVKQFSDKTYDFSEIFTADVEALI